MLSPHLKIARSFSFSQPRISFRNCFQIITAFLLSEKIDNYEDMQLLHQHPQFLIEPASRKCLSFWLLMNNAF
jgi:hypothetical protein